MERKKITLDRYKKYMEVILKNRIINGKMKIDKAIEDLKFIIETNK